MFRLAILTLMLLVMIGDNVAVTFTQEVLYKELNDRQ